MGRLSELWFRVVEKISTIVFSFIFFWSILVYLVHIEDKISAYLGHLSDQTGNDGYSAIKTLVWVVSIVVDIILALIPFAVTGLLIRGDKVADKKRYILQLMLRILLFWVRLL